MWKHIIALYNERFHFKLAIRFVYIQRCLVLMGDWTRTCKHFTKDSVN